MAFVDIIPGAGKADEAADGAVGFAKWWKGAEKVTSGLSKSQLKSITSLEKRIAEHQKKLLDYISNPDLFDNKGFLKGTTSEEIRKQIIEKRIRHLNKEIETFQQNIDKIKSEVE